MGIKKLVERLKAKDFERDYDCTPFECGVFGLLDDAATALSMLQAENEKLRAELEQVKRERAAAVEDVAAIIGDVEEIRRGYGVDNADADGAFAELCETYCANKGRFCYAECEKYHCKNFKWRGQKEG